MVKVAVTGGRDYRGKARVWAVLDAAVERLGLTSGVDGHAPGADLYARQWAAARGVPWVSIKAEWHRYGRAAGPRRNARVLAEQRPEILIAFPGGDGTADMIRQATAAGVRVILIDQ